MIDWLYTLPDWVLLAFWAALLAGLMVVLPFLTHRVPWLRPNPENSDFVLRLQATLFTITSFVVAFTLVEAEVNFRKVDALISAEASHINRLDRLLVRYGDGAGEPVRPQLLVYARSVVADEWPALLASGNGSDKTQQTFVLFSRSILAIEPSLGRQTNIHAEILRSFDAVAEARDARLSRRYRVLLSATFWQAHLVRRGDPAVRQQHDRAHALSLAHPSWAARWPRWAPSSASCSSWTSRSRDARPLDPQAIVADHHDHRRALRAASCRPCPCRRRSRLLDEATFMGLAVLGLISNLMTLAWLAAYVLAIARIGHWLGRSALHCTLEGVTGAALIGLGAGARDRLGVKGLMPMKYLAMIVLLVAAACAAKNEPAGPPAIGAARRGSRRDRRRRPIEGPPNQPARSRSIRANVAGADDFLPANELARG